MSLFLSVFRLTPWSAGALWVHFSAWASKTHMRAWTRWGTFVYSRGCLWLVWTVQVPCLGFMGFLCEPRNISLFHSSIFLLQYSLFISSISKSLFPVSDVVPLRMPWIQQELDPGTLHTWWLYQNFCKIWILLFFFRVVFSQHMKSCSSWLNPSYYERPEEENIIHHFGAMHFSMSVAHILELQYNGFLYTTSVSTYVC